MTNSVSRYLDAESKAATLIAMRSATNDIILIVEGDEDLALLSNCLGLENSRFLVSDGKEILMELFGLGPTNGLDSGMIFIRDRDHDNISTNVRDGILLAVTNRYDIELELLDMRLFRRIYNEFSGKLDNDDSFRDAWRQISDLAAEVGALRLISAERSLNLDFKNLKFERFLDKKQLTVDQSKLVNYISAKSKIQLNLNDILAEIKKQRSQKDAIDLARGKDCLHFMQAAFSNAWNYCSSNKCSIDILSMMVRLGTTVEDFSRIPFYQDIKNHMIAHSHNWIGRPLP
tara:strand:- start:952 stop:1815 length:864 start_codon:yes stop_codon:yes gene_type:complete